MVLRKGLSLAQRISCNHLVINPDNQDVTETMKNGGHSSGATETIFDYFYHLPCDFIREANKVAHELGRLARFTLSVEWFEDRMDDIVSLLTNHVTII